MIEMKNMILIKSPRWIAKEIPLIGDLSTEKALIKKDKLEN